MISFSDRLTPLSLSSLPLLEAVVVLSVSSLDSARFMLRLLAVVEVEVEGLQITSSNIKVTPEMPEFPHRHKG